MSDNMQTQTGAKQIEILPGQLTEAGENIGLRDGAAITDNGFADEVELQ